MDDPIMSEGISEDETIQAGHLSRDKGDWREATGVASASTESSKTSPQKRGGSRYDAYRSYLNSSPQKRWSSELNFKKSSPKTAEDLGPIEKSTEKPLDEKVPATQDVLDQDKVPPETLSSAQSTDVDQPASETSIALSSISPEQEDSPTPAKGSKRESMTKPSSYSPADEDIEKMTEDVGSLAEEQEKEEIQEEKDQKEAAFTANDIRKMLEEGKHHVEQEKQDNEEEIVAPNETSRSNERSQRDKKKKRKKSRRELPEREESRRHHHHRHRHHHRGENRDSHRMDQNQHQQNRNESDDQNNRRSHEGVSNHLGNNRVVPRDASRRRDDVSSFTDTFGTNEAIIEKRRQRRRKRWIIYVVIVLVVVASIQACVFFIFTGKDKVSEGTKSEGVIDKVPTPVPIPLPTENPSYLNVSPSETPTTGALYGPPSPEICDQIAKNQTLDGQDLLPTKDIEMLLDVTLFYPSEISMFVPQLVERFQNIVVPSLAGCSDTSQRILETQSQEVNGGTRRLENDNSFIIVNAVINGNHRDGQSCIISSKECYRVVLDMHLFLERDARTTSLLKVITESILRGSTNLVTRLDLPTPFKFVEIAGLDNLTPTKDPTSQPSFKPTASPSSTPTTTVPPTTSLVAPTKVPSPPPTPKPSRRPTPGPTSFPSARPTRFPTRNPTPRPSPRPSPWPSPRPSPRPTSAPSESPTLKTTSAPTRSPTFKPTVSSEPTVCTSEKCIKGQYGACDATTTLSRENIGCGSCSGNESCLGLSGYGFVGIQSCQGRRSCFNTNAYMVGDSSCMGDTACVRRAIQVDENSCHGTMACAANNDEYDPLTIIIESCHGLYSCFSFGGTVESSSCHGFRACAGRKDIEIGPDSCQGQKSCSAENFNSISIPSITDRTLKVGIGSCNCDNCCICMDEVGDDDCNELGQCCDKIDPTKRV